MENSDQTPTTTPAEGMDAAPTHEERAKQVVEHFARAWFALQAADQELDAMYKPSEEVIKAGIEDETAPLEISRKQVYAYAIGAQMTVVMQTLAQIHHRLGHVLFDACWENTEVGHEFDLEDDAPPADMVSLFKQLGFAVITGEDVARAVKAKEN